MEERDSVKPSLAVMIAKRLHAVSPSRVLHSLFEVYVYTEPRGFPQESSGVIQGESSLRNSRVFGFVARGSFRRVLLEIICIQLQGETVGEDYKSAARVMKMKIVPLFGIRQRLSKLGEFV